MELRQLEYFRAIVDAGTISGAARVLHMTQPPLSYQIKMLEEELQVPLLIRGTKKITLTEAGKTLYEQAGTLLMFADLTRREVVKSSQSATLHIGMTPSTVSLLADYLLRFSWKYPHIHFEPLPEIHALRFRAGRSVLRYLSHLRGRPHGNDNGRKRPWHRSSAGLHAESFP